MHSTTFFNCFAALGRLKSSGFDKDANLFAAQLRQDGFQLFAAFVIQPFREFCHHLFDGKCDGDFGFLLRAQIGACGGRAIDAAIPCPTAASSTRRANPPCPKASSWAAWASCKRKAAFQTTPNAHKPSANKNSLDAISRLFCYVETSEYLSDSRIRPTFSDDPGLRSSEKIETPIRGVSLPTRRQGTQPQSKRVLIPDVWGKSSD